mmetsp:Transcript_12991/g.52003  ORF Transcript_12991/g.52003 Transcript_12991/m.52003 type:complete len:256 (+) Transcript_12991:1180-1947(+)
MMATRSQSASTSGKRCDVRTTERACMVDRSTFHRLRRETGSSPADGSSRRQSSGSPMTAIATQSLRFMPPLRRPASLRACGRSSSWSSAASTSAAASVCGTPRSCAKSRRWSRQLSRFQSAFICVTTPSVLAACSKSSRTEWPATRMSPAVGACARMIALSTVDLPAPFAPSRPNASPLATRNDASCTATVSSAVAPLAGYTLRRRRTTSVYAASRVSSSVNASTAARSASTSASPPRTAATARDGSRRASGLSV